MSFDVGALIDVFKVHSSGGWAKGRVQATGVVGAFPMNYVEEVAAPEPAPSATGEEEEEGGGWEEEEEGAEEEEAWEEGAEEEEGAWQEGYEEEEEGGLEVSGSDFNAHSVCVPS